MRAGRRRAAAAAAAGLAGVALLAGGCLGSQPPPAKTRYVLEVAPERVADPGEAGSVRVGRVRVASLFERKALVYRTGEERYASDFYHEFYAPPGELVREAVAGWLARADVFTRVLEPGDPDQADWWLEGRVFELYGDLRRSGRPEAVVEAGFSLLDARPPEPRTVMERRYRAVVALEDERPRSVVEGLRQGLVEILARLEGDLAVATGSPGAVPDGAPPGAEPEDLRR